MAVADISWPYYGLPPRKVTPEIIPATTGGGRAITSVEQIVSYDVGYWQIILDEIPYASRNNKLLWRAIAAVLDGRAGTCSVPIYDTGPQNAVPWPLDGKGRQILPPTKPIPHSDGALFSDGSGYSQPWIVASVAVTAPVGSTRVSINVTNADDLQPGMHFSIADRLYRIKRINSTVGGVLTDDQGNVLTNDAGQPLTSDFVLYRLTITPPLRDAISAGEEVEFDDPRCICRLLTDTEMLTGVDSYRGDTVAKVTFVEAINL